jgi:hypothetical protein
LSGTQIRDRHGGSGNCGAIWIDDGTADSSLIGLRNHSDGHNEDHSDNQNRSHEFSPSGSAELSNQNQLNRISGDLNNNEGE